MSSGLKFMGKDADGNAKPVSVGEQGEIKIANANRIIINEIEDNFGVTLEPGEATSLTFPAKNLTFWIFNFRFRANTFSIRVDGLTVENPSSGRHYLASKIIDSSELEEGRPGSSVQNGTYYIDSSMAQYAGGNFVRIRIENTSDSSETFFTYQFRGW